LFISFEGGEGSGKSTHTRRLAERLERNGTDVLLVREPGSTPLGQYLRNWLKQERQDDDVSPTAELLLFAAARAELVEKVIQPALANGTTIITDRFSDSTVAYQGYGRGISLDEIDAVNNVATKGIIPNLTILLDCPPDVGLARGVDGKGQRRFEDESVGFHTRVREGFLSLAKATPNRWSVVDATQNHDAVADAIWSAVSERLD